MKRQGRAFVAALLLVVGCAKQQPAAQHPLAAEQQAVTTPAILAPQRGEVLFEGQSYTIRWQTPGWDSVNIAAVMGGKDRGHLAFAKDGRADSLVWEIPQGWVTGFGIERADSVRLRLEDAGDPHRFVDSAPFTVRGAAP